MYTPHTATIYNVTVKVDPVTLREETTNHITILNGVFLDESKGANVRTSGLENADAATLYIPFDVRAVDGLNGSTKRFVPWDEFIKAEDKSALWTLDVGRNTYFVKGVVVGPDAAVSKLEMTTDGVYMVSKVDAKDYGSPSMQHWEVGGA